MQRVDDCGCANPPSQLPASYLRQIDRIIARRGTPIVCEGYFPLVERHYTQLGCQVSLDIPDRGSWGPCTGLAFTIICPNGVPKH